MASLRRYVLASTDLLLSPRRESRSGRVSDSASKPAVALFITGRGGGGHKAAAAALHDCLQQDGAEWASAIEMVDGQRLFDEAIAGGGKVRHSFDGDEWYNYFMRRGYYRIAGFCGYIATTAIRLRRRKLERGFEIYFRKRQPLLVVSFVPYFNGMYRTALRRACPSATLITVVTDMANSPAHTWIDPWDAESPNYVVACGTEELQSQARALGYPEANILASSGMVVNPAFYARGNGGGGGGGSPGGKRGGRNGRGKAPMPAAAALPTEVSATGAGSSTDGASPVPEPENPLLPVALIFFGGVAPLRTANIARRALVSHPELALVIICGGNAQLEKELRETLAGPRCVVEGLVPAQRVREHLQVAAVVGLVGWAGWGLTAVAFASQRADCVIGKPGPGVVAEAAVCGVPFVTERRNVMPQARREPRVRGRM